MKLKTITLLRSILPLFVFLELIFCQRVVGYYPQWVQSEFPANNIDLSVVTHVNHAFAWPNQNGDILFYNNMLDPSINQAIHNQGRKILLSLGGWGNDVGFATVAASAELRTIFIENLINICETYNYDGVDLDGDKEIIFGDYNGFLHVMNSYGQELSGFPFDTGDDIWGSPALADLNLDGSLEIVVTSKSKHLFILDIHGNVLLDYDANQFLMGTPSIGNLDGDNELEIVFGAYTNSGDIFAINYDGSNVEGFPFELNEKMLGLALADIDSDNIDEIVFSTESENLIGYIEDNNGQLETNVLYTASNKFRSDPSVLKVENNFYFLSGNEDNKMYCIDINGDTVFEFETGSPIQTASGFTLIEGVGVGIFFGSQDNHLYGVDIYGDLLPGWPVDLGGKVNSSPVFADIDGDGHSEVITATDNGVVFSLNLDGSIVQNFPISLGTAFIGSPSVGDIDLDGDLEIFVGSTANLTGLDFKLDGNVIGQWNMFHGNVERTSFFEFNPDAGCDNPLLGDINCDSSIDIYDLTILVEIVLELSNPFEYQIWASDANLDGSVDIYDIISIVLIILED